MTCIKSGMNLKMGHNGPMAADCVPLIFKIAFEYSTGHVFSLINFKLSQSDVLDKMSVNLETWSCGVKK